MVPLIAELAALEFLKKKNNNNIWCCDKTIALISCAVSSVRRSRRPLPLVGSVLVYLYYSSKFCLLLCGIQLYTLPTPDFYMYAKTKAQIICAAPLFSLHG